MVPGPRAADCRPGQRSAPLRTNGQTQPWRWSWPCWRAKRPVLHTGGTCSGCLSHAAGQSHQPRPHCASTGLPGASAIRVPPLWRDLVDAVPDVSLSQTRPRGLGLFRRSDPLDLRLHRTVIEIRDAILDLRAYIPQAVLDDVQAHLEHESSPRRYRTQCDRMLVTYSAICQGRRCTPVARRSGRPTPRGC
ncbi:DUF6545 domain-containing protein [Streptomyces cinnamoneus]|uniref:DUF6545 domain-containing protein n=1 Tax=Streptomyces cinnamoneus TaxID=53446 RepID=UPI0030B89CC8